MQLEWSRICSSGAAVKCLAVGLSTVIDSLHFVSSHASPGVPMADLAAYILQWRSTPEKHRTARSAMNSLSVMVDERAMTWREPWPAELPSSGRCGALLRRTP